MKINGPQIAKFCQRHHITKMMSYANPHRAAAEKDDVLEFLVDFEKGYIPGYFDMSGGPGLIGMEEELAMLLEKEQVYLHSSTGINPFFRTKAVDDAIAAAELVYPEI